MSQDSDARTDYFEYLENVLGIKTILQPREVDVVSSIATELLFGVQGYKTYSAEEIDLLSKMIAAVKVDSARLKVCDLQEAKKYQAECLVIFQDDVLVNSSRSNQQAFDVKLTVQTFSPRVLLKKPELKKMAWTELQKVLQHFA